MIVILAAALGVSLGVIIGVFGVVLWSRRAFKGSPGVFAVKTRERADGKVAPKWPRRSAYARWVHDVLIVGKGIALLRVQALAVSNLSSAVAEPTEANTLGDGSFVAALLLDSGDVVELATASADRTAAIGPFGELVTKG